MRFELTRGAVYSSLPSKRSLYLAVLLDSLPGLAARAAAATEPCRHLASLDADDTWDPPPPTAARILSCRDER
jgi:hypothetical protein